MSEHDEIISHMKELEAMKLADMTLGEARDRLRELSSLEQKQRVLDVQSNYQPVVSTTHKPPVIPYVPMSSAVRGRKSKPKISEVDVGRYVMTTVAAVLCLLAFGVLILTIWGSMPDMGKFLLFLAVGIGLESLGTWRASKQYMRPFWLGVAGLGAGISFIDLTAGCLFWGLYELVLTGIFVIIWFIANLYLGRKQSAGIYYVISYIGGLIASLLACEIMVVGSYGETALILITAVIAVAGYLECTAESKQYLVLFNISYCGIVCLCLVSLLRDSSMFSWVALPWFCVVLALWCLYLTRKVRLFQGDAGIAIRVVITFILSLLARASVTSACQNEGVSVLVMNLLLIVVLCVPAIKADSGYLMGVVVALSDSVIAVSQECNFDILLLTVVLAISVWVVGISWSWDNRVALLISYGYALMRISEVNQPDVLHVIVAIVTFIALLACIAGYACRSIRENIWFNKPFDLLVVSALPGASMSVFTKINLVPMALQCTVVMVCLYIYYFLYLDRCEEAPTQNVKIAWYVARVVTYLALLSNILFADTADKIILTCAMMITIGFNLYQMIHTKSGAHAILCCLLANWQMLCLTGMWDFKINILTSIAGILIAAGFVAAGFLLDIKASRQVGLGCAVLYSIKLGLFDVAGNTGIGTAGGLLIAGLLCFGISLAYNQARKLDESVNQGAESYEEESE